MTSPVNSHNLLAITPKFFGLADRETYSAIIMDNNNEHVESLIFREGETDETWDEFLERLENRVKYLNNNNQ